VPGFAVACEPAMRGLLALEGMWISVMPSVTSGKGERKCAYQ
jgi:hypothetical protein